ncbi:hypothetical protein SAY86_005997 [Trapa natans]|uniref:Uncharacterized protein n=1 Tax=Trapa natans TaxID=22666 RepID=A0AAN7L6G5_TRANT|nr:hypothetical protein SAY86_005997 [Trapa natans]
MADMDQGLPSFSLGIDFDSPPPSPNLHHFDQSPDYGGDDEDIRSTEDPPPTLRRLQRGIRVIPTPEACIPSFKFEDDIEEFSSEEYAKKPSSQYGSLCGSSKLPLHRPFCTATASCDQLNSAKRRLPSYGVGSSSQQASCNRQLKDSTASSPVRKFVLIDSDSDDPSITEHCYGEEATKADFPTKRKLAASPSEPENEDLWKHFLPMKSFNVPTPAFDEVCNEYFLSAKDKLNKNQKPSSCSSLGDDVICLQQRTSEKTSQNHLLPSHQYFLHSEMRIQNLVQSRWPHFFPIGGNNEELRHLNTSAVDYMGQFNNGDSHRNKKVSKGKAKSRASNVQEHSSVENWLNPESSVSVPTNVGKRRVSANVSAGHWYTGADGRKVYVTANGQELTGSAAYRSYRKESGVGFKKSRKKPKANKKAKG